MRDLRAVVYQENTLGLMVDFLTGKALQPLAANIHGHNWKNGMIMVDENSNDLRDATMQDFDTFRVKHHPDYLIK